MKYPGRAAMAVVLCTLLAGCSGPVLFARAPEPGAAASTVRFHRARDVIGGSGASYTIVDMGEGVPANGLLMADLSINPYQHYRDSGASRPNLTLLTGPQPVRGPLRAIVVDNSGLVHETVAPGEHNVWTGLGRLGGGLPPEVGQGTIQLRRGAPPPVAEVVFGHPYWSLAADERRQLATMARGAPAGKVLIAFYGSRTCRTFAATGTEALRDCTTPVQVVGSTGFGSEGLTWKRPPGKMRLLVVSPNVQAVCDKGEVVVEPGRTYDVEFDSRSGTFKLQAL